MTIIIIVTVLLIAVIGFGLIMNRVRTEGMKIRPAPAPRPNQTPPEDEFRQILEVLLKLNLMVRRDRDFPKEMLLNIEEIIDDLKAIIPAMMELYPDETLTCEIKKIGLTHLYKIVNEFISLSPDSRKTQSKTFKETLKSLHEVSRKSRNIVEKDETTEFKAMAHLIAEKYS